MQELLLAIWGPHIAAYTHQYPWQIFAAVLVISMVLVSQFRKYRSSSGADVGIGDGDGGGCGD